MKRILSVSISLIFALAASAILPPAHLWLDTDGRPINAHGGGLLTRGDTTYWYGEHKAADSNAALVGVTVYSTTDPALEQWQYRGVAFAVSDTVGAPTERGCVIERPKVVYCQLTHKYVMYAHLEHKGRGYAAAERFVAVSDTPTGPFHLIANGRPNQRQWPLGFTKQQKRNVAYRDKMKWWTPEWRQQVEDGMYVCRDYDTGQQSRDQTVFVDTDGKAYHIYSSEDNLTLHVAELTPDYLGYTGRYARIDPAGHNEAPAIFRRGDTYYLITSGCTGWAPNAARLFTATSPLGPWTKHPNPCVGPEADKTFQGQSTYCHTMPDGTVIFMADVWRPKNPIDGRYLWLPVEWDKQTGLPILQLANSK